MNQSERGLPVSVQIAAAWSWRLLIIGIATAALVWVGTKLELLLVPVAIAVLLAVLLHPLVAVLQKRLKFPRGLAVLLTLLVAFLALGGLVAAAGASMVSGIADLWVQASDGFAKLLIWLADGPLHLSTADLQGYIEQLQDQIGKIGSTLVSGALKATTTVGNLAAGILIALFSLIFFLLDGRRIWTWTVGLFPVAAREQIHQAGRRGWMTLSGYVRTQILVAAVDALGIGIGAAVLQVPLALPMAVMVFLGSFVPVVGAMVTGAIAILVALVAHGPWSALWMLIVVIIVQQIEGQILQPLVMGQAVSLHPLAVLLVVAAGSFVAGIVGALFAVPLAAVANTVVLYLHGHDKFPELGVDDRLEHRAPPTRKTIAVARLLKRNSAAHSTETDHSAEATHNEADTVVAAEPDLVDEMSNTAGARSDRPDDTTASAPSN